MLIHIARKISGRSLSNVHHISQNTLQNTTYVNSRFTLSYISEQIGFPYPPQEHNAMSKESLRLLIFSRNRYIRFQISRFIFPVCEAVLKIQIHNQEKVYAVYFLSNIYFFDAFYKTTNYENTFSF